MPSGYAAICSAASVLHAEKLHMLAAIAAFLAALPAQMFQVLYGMGYEWVIRVDTDPEFPEPISYNIVHGAT